MLIGYARSSPQDAKPTLEAQVASLTAAGCERVLQEHTLSVNRWKQRDAAYKAASLGDTLVVVRIDRLASSIKELVARAERLERKGVGLRILDFGGIAVDTQGPPPLPNLSMFAAFAQFEHTMSTERQRDGIAKRKAKDQRITVSLALRKYKGGRPATAQRKGPHGEDAENPWLLTGLYRQKARDQPHGRITHSKGCQRGQGDEGRVARQGWPCVLSGQVACRPSPTDQEESAGRGPLPQ
jgi:DNA invertase Pin-like site-specific DNA recombinase